MQASVVICVLIGLFALANCSSPEAGYVGHILSERFRAVDEEMLRNGVDPKDTLPPAMWYTQRLDHFNPQNSATWQQKYYYNDTFYAPGGPIFLYISGEGPLAPRAVTSLQLNIYAQQYGALVVALEHRFYGDSQPTTDLSTENLAYLSSQQGLADLASFRQWFNSQHGNPDTKWVVFGGSYAGAMSSWFRLKFPHLVVGAVASSGPVLAKLDFLEYLQVVQSSLAYGGGQQCVDNVRSAFTSVQAMLKDPSQWSTVQKTFNTCAALSGDNDVYTLYSNLAGYFMGVVQYDNEVPTALNITDICTMMTNASDPLTGLVNVNNWFNQQGCQDVSYANMIAGLKNVTATQSGSRQWTYQTCTEFGYFQTTDADTNSQPFGTLQPLSYSLQICQDLFGLAPGNPNIDWANTLGGANNPRGYNIVFPNGSLDPWHALGVLNDEPIFETSVFITGTAHCADLHQWQEGDVLELLAAQKAISSLIGVWLSE